MTSQLVGTLSDKHGRRPVQIAAQLGQVACLLLLALALRQVVDYGVAALCLPSLGFMRQLDKELAVSLLAFSRGTAGLLGNYKVSLQSYTADISGAEECPERMAYLGAAMVVGLCSGLKHSLYSLRYSRRQHGGVCRGEDAAVFSGQLLCCHVLQCFDHATCSLAVASLSVCHT